MRGLKRFVPSPAMVVATIALAVALGGTGWAAGSTRLGQAGAAQNAVPAKAGGPSATGPRGPRGPRGPAGPRGLRGPGGPAGPAGAAGAAGPAGPAGAAATALWASVDGTGTLIRSKGVASAQLNATGDYQVIFNQDVTGCNYQATLGGPSTGLFVGYVTAAQRLNIPAGVRVLTFNSAPTAVNIPFFLAVFC